MAAEDVRSGVYRHYKGHYYLVLGVGRMDSDNRLVVIYTRLYSRNNEGPPISVRYLNEFSSTAPDGSGKLRFEYVGVQEPGLATTSETPRREKPRRKSTHEAKSEPQSRRSDRKKKSATQRGGRS